MMRYFIIGISTIFLGVLLFAGWVYYMVGYTPIFPDPILRSEQNLVLVSYIKESEESGKNGYAYWQYKLGRTALNYGFRKILNYNETDLAKDFVEENNHILSQKKGGGYWLWKPYIILDAMKRSSEGSLIFYVDTGFFFKGDVAPLLEYMKNYDRILIGTDKGVNNKKHTKLDALILMGCDKSDCKGYVGGGFLVFKNNSKNREFVSEWLEYSKDERIITDKPSTLGKDAENFAYYHRHDQAILSLMSGKYSKGSKYTSWEDLILKDKILSFKLRPQWWNNKKQLVEEYMARARYYLRGKMKRV